MGSATSKVICQNVACERFDRTEPQNCCEFKDLTDECCVEFLATPENMWISVLHELPALGQRVLLFSNGVIQSETYTLDAYDASDYSPMVYFWSRDDLDECPEIQGSDYWIAIPDPPVQTK